MGSLEFQIERLTRTNRRMRAYMVVGWLATLACLALGAMQETKAPDVVRAKSVEIVNSRNSIVARIFSTDAGDGRIEMFDRDGKRTLSMPTQLGEQKTNEAASEPAWKDRSKWRQLRKGMTKSEVSSLFGEPHRVNSPGSLTFWYWDYPRGGNVSFDDKGVFGWAEP